MTDRDVQIADTSTGRMGIPRSRSAVSGLLLVLLGIWGALIPLVGPYFNFGYEPDTPWMWTSARGWLNLLPGAVTVVGGLMLMMSRNRATALLGGWLAVLAGAWFIVGRLFATPLGLGDLGAPVPTGQTGLIALELTFFTGLGSLIIALGAMAVGRLRDIRYPTPASAEADESGRRPIPERRHRDWRHPFGGPRPIPH